MLVIEISTTVVEARIDARRIPISLQEDDFNSCMAEIRKNFTERTVVQQSIIDELISSRACGHFSIPRGEPSRSTWELGSRLYSSEGRVICYWNRITNVSTYEKPDRIHPYSLNSIDFHHYQSIPLERYSSLPDTLRPG
ncbi:hypothetical protein ACFX2I_037419 [Malus domestica]